MRPLLVLATYPPELRAIPAVLRRAGGVVTGVVGVGVVAATARTASLLAETGPRAVLLVGTAGAYPGWRGRIGEACVAVDVRLADAASVLGRAALPGRVRVRRSARSWVARALEAAGARPAEVATVLGITVDDSLARLLARRTGADLEHLEAFGVASACSASRVPFAGLLGVANVVGSSGRAEWRRNEKRALGAVRAVLARAARSPSKLL